jgi:uncharacterized protein YxjI
MNPILHQNLFLIKEHIGMFKAANNFDIYNPETGEQMMTCREEKLSFFTKMFRFTKYKIMTPFHVEIKDLSGAPIISITRKSSFFGFALVNVLDENGKVVGSMKRKFRLGGAKLELNDAAGELLCTLKGNFIGWDFKITKEEQELATISKKWAGIGKELFTSADNYILSINDQVAANENSRMLMLAAVLCIDFLLKEN